MRAFLLASIMLTLAGAAQAQTTQTGTIDGLNYLQLTSPDGCSTANPCQIVTYLHYLGGEGATPDDVNTYFNNSAFWSANPHTIVLAPMVNGSSDTNNWGGVQSGVSPNMQAAVDLVKQTEAQNPTNPNSVVLTGGSMGGIGTQAGMEEFGPQGTTGQHIFTAGLAYDGAIYNSDPATEKSALCGVPLTLVHGTADTTVSPGPDQQLEQTLSGCSGFKMNWIQDATHGTWNNPDWQGYGNGDQLINQVMAQARSGAGTTTSSSGPTSTSTSMTPTMTPAAYTPSSTSNGDGTGPSISQGSSTPTQTTLTGTNTPTTNPATSSTSPSQGPAIQGACSIGTSSAAPAGPTGTSGATPTGSTGTSSAAPTGSTTGQFTTKDGIIIGPNGQPFQARGINVMWGSENPDANTLTQTFPGINFVRLAIYDYNSPSELSDYVNNLTSKGIVVELENHNNGAGNAGGNQGSVFTGQQLQQEQDWYSSVASAFKNNPNVWFGTNNEPSDNPSAAALSDWQKTTYDTIRNTGNQNPIMLEINGWANGDQPVMAQGYTPSVYAGMTNVVADPHYYGWMTNSNTDQATNSNMVAQMIQQIQQQLPTANGAMPVIIGEYGPSTDGQSLDANWQQVITAVQGSGAGNVAWAWMTGDNAHDALLADSSGNLTSYGQEVQAYIKASANSCSAAPSISTPISTNNGPTIASNPTTPASPTNGNQTNQPTGNGPTTITVSQKDPTSSDGQPTGSPPDTPTTSDSSGSSNNHTSSNTPEQVVPTYSPDGTVNTANGPASTTPQTSTPSNNYSSSDTPTTSKGSGSSHHHSSSSTPEQVVPTYGPDGTVNTANGPASSSPTTSSNPSGGPTFTVSQTPPEQVVPTFGPNNITSNVGGNTGNSTNQTPTTPSTSPVAYTTPPTSSTEASQLQTLIGQPYGQTAIKTADQLGVNAASLAAAVLNATASRSGL